VKKAIALVLALITLTGIGSVNQVAAIPYVVIAAVITVTALIALDKIDGRCYPIYIYGLALALLWQTSMLGSYIVGADIHGEFFAANKAIIGGWDLGYVSTGNTSLALGGLSQLLAKLGIGLVWQFKVLYPAMFAIVPVILYLAYSRMVGAKRGYFAVMFFAVTPVFFVEVVGIAKSMIAEVFLAALVLLVVVNIKSWKRILSISGVTVLASLCHYTIGLLMIIYLIGGLLTLLIGKVIRLKCLRGEHLSLKYSSLIVVVTLASAFLWFSNVADGRMIDNYIHVGKCVVGSVGILFESPLEMVEPEVAEPEVVEPEVAEPEVVEPEVAEPEVVEPEVVEPEVIEPEVVEPEVIEPVIIVPEVIEPVIIVPEVIEPTIIEPVIIELEVIEPEVIVPEIIVPELSYLYKQEPLVKTAIGLDFGDATTGGKGFRVLQYTMQLFLVLGGIYFLLRYKRYKFTTDFASYVIVSFGLLGLCLFLPLFSTIINASRFYHIALFFLAPIWVIGVEEVVRDVSRIASRTKVRIECLRKH